jgi:nucleoside-diphosphate-sugar epimerase
MKALVIGAKGNIGRPLVKHLRERGYEVLTADIEPGCESGYLMADINHPIDLLPAFDERPDVVHLLAAVVSRVTCEQASSLAVQTNLAGVNNVIQLCQRTGARLVYYSTSEVYGPTDGPMREDATPRPNNRYGLTKYLGEQLVQYESREHDLEAVIVRPFMVYSEDETEGDHRSAMIRFASDIHAGRTVTVHKNTWRAWMHVSDAVRAFEAASQCRSGQIINIGTDEVIDTFVLADAIRSRLNPAARIDVVAQPPRMTPYKVPDIKRQRDLLGVVPAVGILDGIARVCDRFK